ncbi:class I mannose-6-phosphate isomerase [Adhaeribacter sp. BT258]|uniref:Phosphohexomutase n=1 Tax=Adhaeribacter terrigena TaxID=2793070 RepID=A0ABS1C6F5_9BACT|nr:type I phosphomannose isomerase catalytic subunit [Adhaeribacter terrigena]MBK0404268.1 class I mannose-6-phosphate isomerase [Adhaeribacter terrigena]
MSELYPLKFKTIFKEKIWGGEKIRTVLHKEFAPLKNCGETWEISGVKENESVVAEGPLAGKTLSELIRNYKGELLGEKNYEKSGDEFPLLVKFIDANEDLSIQVHPNDEIAWSRHKSLGKTEVWYIMQADEGATLISGFNREMDEPTYLKHLEGNRLGEILNKEDVKAGDVFFIPGGRVHTIGKGLLLAEIQQSSDITYRIYDFDRTDDEGNKRELHTEEALAAIDYQHYPSYKNTYQDELNKPVELAKSNYFTTNLLHLDQPLTRDYTLHDSFVILICVQGKAVLQYNGTEIALKTGDCYLLPAAIKQITIRPLEEFKMLECFA